MTRRSRAAMLVCIGLTVLAVIGATVIGGIIGGQTSRFFAASILAFTAVGGVIARSHPRNTIGWTFVGGSTLVAVNELGDSIVSVGVPYGWPAWLCSTGALLTGVLWFPGLVLMITIGLLHFPNGRPLSRRWRWADWATLAVLGIYMVSFAIGLPGLPLAQLTGDETPHQDNWQQIFLTIGVACLPAVAPLLLVAAASIIVRWRRSDAVGRLQIRWVAVAGTAAIIIEIGTSVFHSYLSNSVETLLEGVAFPLIAVAVGVAVQRYKLYEIDRIISRTVSYVLISALLIGVYVGIVAVAGAVVPSQYGSAGVAAATLVVAALFLPVRRRIGGLVDRRFNRARYDAARIVDRFAIQIRTDLSQDELSRELLRTVHRTMSPVTASVWLTPR